MSTLSALITTVAPLLPIFVPGLWFLRPNQDSIPTSAARSILISLVSTILLTFTFTLLHLPLTAPAGIFLILITYRTWHIVKNTNLKLYRWHALAVIVPIVIFYGLFSTIFILKHGALPTGDSQKAIFWANEIRRTGTLPNYDRAITQLNRDPVDFLTPGLHTLTAYVQSLSPHPLISIGLFSIAVSGALVYLAAALAHLIFQSRSPILIPALSSLLAFSQLRFLRYLREPGYHYQNIFGEILLFGYLFYALSFLKKSSKSSALFAIIIGATLLITHQFSAFIAGLLTLPLLIAMFIKNRAKVGIISLLLLIAGIYASFTLNLAQKIPHIFTTTPHLLSLVPPLSTYPSIMGSLWFFLGLTGLIVFTVRALQSPLPKLLHITFATLTAILLLLSQGPRFGIDIPPVRALFYSVIPLSIFGAYATSQLLSSVNKSPRCFKWATTAAIITAITTTSALTINQSIASSSTNIRTNSTLTAPQNFLIDKLSTPDNSRLLIDDYNHRASSWLLLAEKPIFARLASGLSRQMEEAGQSAIRNDLYLNQLDYEKIYSLGSNPILAHLLQKHDLTHLAGVQKSSQFAFSHNPLLNSQLLADPITLFAPSNPSRTPPCPIDSTCAWLLNPTTLVNDIGDPEDTFSHLPASLHATRLSDPIVENNTTYRTTTAPIIALEFNVQDYTRILWEKAVSDQDNPTIKVLITLTRPVPGLSLTTRQGDKYPLESGQPITIPFSQSIFSSKGYLEVAVENPRQNPVSIDLIAASISQTQ